MARFNHSPEPGVQNALHALNAQFQPLFSRQTVCLTAAGFLKTSLALRACFKMVIQRMQRILAPSLVGWFRCFYWIFSDHARCGPGSPVEHHLWSASTPSRPSTRDAGRRLATDQPRKAAPRLSARNRRITTMSDEPKLRRDKHTDYK
jgi:hypothetical protein